MSERREGGREGESAVMQASRELTEAGRLFAVAAMRSAMAVVWRGLGSTARADSASLKASLAVARAIQCVERYAELMVMGNATRERPAEGVYSFATKGAPRVREQPALNGWPFRIGDGPGDERFVQERCSFVPLESLPGPALAGGRLDALGGHADAGPVEVDADDDGRGEGLAALGAVEWARVTVGDGAAVTAEQERSECGHAVDARTDGSDEAGTAGARGVRGKR